MEILNLNGYKKEALYYVFAVIFYFCFLSLLHFCVYGGFVWYGKSISMTLCALLFALLCNFYENSRGFIACYLLFTCIVVSYDVSALLYGAVLENFDMRGTAFYVAKYFTPFFIAWRACSFIKNLTVQRILCIVVGALFGRFVVNPLHLWIDIITNGFSGNALLVMK